MECPKCQGGSYLVDEDLVQVLEKTETPTRLLIKATYQCRSCSDRFTRLFFDELEARRKPQMQPGQYYQQPQQQEYQERQENTTADQAAEGLKFF